METNTRTPKKNERGITLLITLLLMGVLLGVSASLLNITLKQYQLAGIARSSEIAFQAANAGLECILYYDFQDPSQFYVDDGGGGRAPVLGLDCMEDSSDDLEGGTPIGNPSLVESGEEQRFRFTWGSDLQNQVCSEVSIYKFSEHPSNDADTIGPLVEVGGRNMRPDIDNNGTGDPCPEGSVCTVVQARGYNVPCVGINSSPRVVEREYTQVY